MQPKECAFLRANHTNRSIGEVIECIAIVGDEFAHIGYNGISRGWVKLNQITSAPLRMQELIPKEFQISPEREALLWTEHEVNNWLQSVSGKNKPSVKDLTGSTRLKKINLMALRALILCAFSKSPSISFMKVHKEGFMPYQGITVHELNKIRAQKRTDQKKKNFSSIHRQSETKSKDSHGAAHGFNDGKLYVGMSDDSVQLSRSMSTESMPEVPPTTTTFSLLKLAQHNFAAKRTEADSFTSTSNSNKFLETPNAKNPNKRQHSPNSSDSSWDQPRKKVSFSASLNEHVTLDDIDRKIVMRKTSTSIEHDETISRGILRKSPSRTRSSNLRSPPASSHPSASSSYPSHLSPDEYQYQRHGNPGTQRTSPFPQRYPQGFSPQTHIRRPYNDNNDNDARNHRDSPRSHGSSSHRSSYESPLRRNGRYESPSKNGRYESPSKNGRYESPSKKTPQYDAQKISKYDDRSPMRNQTSSRYKDYNEFNKTHNREGDSHHTGSSHNTGSPASYLEPPRESKPKQKLSFENALGEVLHMSEDSERTQLADWHPEDVFEFLCERIPALSRYRRVWLPMAIDGNFVVHLTRRDLEEMGVRSRVIQKRILFCIATELKGEPYSHANDHHRGGGILPKDPHETAACQACTIS